MSGVSNAQAMPVTSPISWRDYLELCKPRVVALMILTSMVGMCLASPGLVPWKIFVFGNLGIALAAGSAATINHLIDYKIDQLMHRTQRRPIARGKISPQHALTFALLLGILSMVILYFGTNGLTAFLSFLTLIGYAIVYTVYLKHATPQNIVIGGAAGAAPPMLGWVAVTGHIDPASLLLMMIIFVWTPPHFWALAIHRIDDYAKAKIPMLPNRYGIPFTKLNILLYTILLIPATALPFMIGMAGWIYLVSAMLLNMRFMYWAIFMMTSERSDIPFKTFRFSIVYLMLLFIAFIADHYYMLFTH